MKRMRIRAQVSLTNEKNNDSWTLCRPHDRQLMLVSHKECFIYYFCYKYHEIAFWRAAVAGVVAEVKGALSQHFSLFPAKNLQKSFFLTFTRAENIALKVKTMNSISFFCKKSDPWHILGFAVKIGKEKN